MVLFLKHIAIEGPGLLLDFFKNLGLKTGIIDISAGESLPSFEDYQAIVFLGGPMNVYETDRYSFLLEEEKFLKKALAKEIPFLGICLGAQILAKVSNAKIKKAPLKEIGWYEVKLTGEGKDDFLFNGLGEKLTVFQWHEDTFDLAPQAKLLARGDTCVNQAFRVGKYAWGLQFHPEIKNGMLRSWLEYYNEDIDRDRILFNYFEKQDVYLSQAKHLCLNFAKVIKQAANVKD
ncbi:MAG: type 1 glutamine amidotransferase [Candidatus Omnitrophica bacterium]|jgi:GMP synthase-like glutamine amidotransferase|nr:type 1 glutamine amidotransferase [Candidatus Omnitrophota bacterium]